MVNWKRLWIAALCAAALIGGSIVLTRFFPNMCLALIVVVSVCALTLSFYMLLDGILDKDNSQKNKEDD